MPACADGKQYHRDLTVDSGLPTKGEELTASVDAGELTQLLFRIQNSRDEDACAKLWQSVYERILTYARGRIAVKDQRVADEEDIAQSAMKSFFSICRSGAIQNAHEQR